MERLRLTTPEELRKLTATRAGETKLGERAGTLENLKGLADHPARFVLLGIREDIGIRANLGTGGATDCWDYTLPALLNVQSNRYFDGEHLLILGTLEFEDLLEEAKSLDAQNDQDLKRLRELSAEIDKAVAELVEKIAVDGKIPIIIGGGHNNAYGNITGCSRGLGKALSVLNIDPHADFRALEGRHSGNGFSYVWEEKSLQRYAVWGLHEGYNSEGMLQRFAEEPGLTYFSFESLLAMTEDERQQRFYDLLNWLGQEMPTGLELDLDALTRFPVSALNPSGFGLVEVRKLIRAATAIKKPVYFHLCEGSPGRAVNEQEKQLLGKSIAYLVSDFIKSLPT